MATSSYGVRRRLTRAQLQLAVAEMAAALGEFTHDLRPGPVVDGLRLCSVCSRVPAHPLHRTPAAIMDAVAPPQQPAEGEQTALPSDILTGDPRRP